jgi:hypothetical protein
MAAEVELQGIEPWSREDKCVRSTCLVDFNFREAQGRQRPQLFLSYCYLNNVAQQQHGPVLLIDTAYSPSAKQKR